MASDLRNSFLRRGSFQRREPLGLSITKQAPCRRQTATTRHVKLANCITSSCCIEPTFGFATEKLVHGVPSQTSPIFPRRIQSMISCWTEALARSKADPLTMSIGLTVRRPACWQVALIRPLPENSSVVEYPTIRLLMILSNPQDSRWSKAVDNYKNPSSDATRTQLSYRVGFLSNSRSANPLLQVRRNQANLTINYLPLSPV